MARSNAVVLSLTFAALGAAGVLGYGLAAPSATLLGPALVESRVDAGGSRDVALTFDDGPSPYTAQVLDILKANRVKATFFLCGENAERYPQLVRRIRAEGHEIGNHTYSHPYLYLMDRERIADEIDRTQAVLKRLGGRKPTLFRPPFGVRWFSLWPLLAERGMTMVMWSDRGDEGAAEAGAIAQRTLEQLRPGAIVLLHDGFETHGAGETDRSAVVAALPAVIAGVRKAGYRFAKLRG